MRLKMAASCLWQVDAINLDQLNVDADDNERGMKFEVSQLFHRVGLFAKVLIQSIIDKRFMFNIDAWIQRYIDALIL